MDLTQSCQGVRGGCKHFDHDEEFGKGRLKHLIRYVPELGGGMRGKVYGCRACSSSYMPF